MFCLRKILYNSLSKGMVSNQLRIRSDEYYPLLLNSLYNLSLCERCQGLVSTPVCYKKRKTKEEKKTAQVHSLLPSKFKEMPTVDVWRNMTVQELAESMNKSCDHLFEAMMYIDNSVYFDQPSSIITDYKVLQDIVKKCGFRGRIVPPPTKDNKNTTEEIKDISRRYLKPDLKLVKKPAG